MIEKVAAPSAKGLDTDEVRNYIIGKTGMSTAIYDNGTHYVTNQKLTMEILKEISDSEDVLEVTGEFTGGLGSYGATHEHDHRQRRAEATRNVPEPEQPPVVKSEARQIAEKKGAYRVAIYTAVGIAGAIALAGFIVSGGIAPNANSNTGAAGEAILSGHIGGPTGLPAVGATVLAVQQGTDFTASAFVSINGQYSLTLPPGQYIVVVAFPDGTDRAVNGLQIESGENHTLNVSY